jgi:hypothetical protein
MDRPSDIGIEQAREWAPGPLADKSDMMTWDHNWARGDN